MPDSVSIQHLLQIGIQFHKDGALAQAKGIYQRILEQEPRHAGALHLWGMVAYEQGQVETAIEKIQAAIEINPSNPIYHSNLGNIFREQRRLEEAALACREAIRLKPDYAEAHMNLGNVLRDCRQLDEAIAEFREAIRVRPQFGQGYANLGSALLEKGQLDEGIAECQHAIQLDPGRAEAHSDLGVALLKKGRSEDAIRSCQEAIRLRPRYAAAYVNLGCALNRLKKFEEAAGAFREAIQIDPRIADAYSNLGTAYFQRGDFEGAIAAFREAAKLEPHNAVVLNNLGSSLGEAGRLRESIEMFRRAVEIDDQYAEAYNNLAGATRRNLQMEESIAAARRAIQIKPNFVDAHFSLSLSLLTCGEFSEGWNEYEWRLRREPEASAQLRYCGPRWNGEDLRNKTILLHAEQGHGDTIHFIRYAPLVAARGGRVVVECQPALTRLLSQIPCVDQVVAEGEPLPKFDLHCPLLSLPFLFKTDEKSIPASVPYLKVDPRLSELWNGRLLQEGEGRRIGLVWAGSPSQIRDKNRSMKFENLSPLIGSQNAMFFSLQKGEAAYQFPKDIPNLRDFSSQLNDFADTAALLDNLDLIITVDTAVGHLAGAIGRPVWVLLAYSPDWRWMLRREDSPCYPAMRLFRQAVPGEWTTVINRVVNALHAAI
jgi:tetratricopeptide (TPR) repeat protein